MRTLAEVLRYIYFTTVIPTLYLLVMWASLTAGLAILINDIFKAAAVISALSLFYIARGYYTAEMMEYNSRQNAKSNETKG